jgi:hypothetical protein
VHRCSQEGSVTLLVEEKGKGRASSVPASPEGLVAWAARTRMRSGDEDYSAAKNHSSGVPFVLFFLCAGI